MRTAVQCEGATCRRMQPNPVDMELPERAVTHKIKEKGTHPGIIYKRAHTKLKRELRAGLVEKEATSNVWSLKQECIVMQETAYHMCNWKAKLILGSDEALRSAE